MRQDKNHGLSGLSGGIQNILASNGYLTKFPHFEIYEDQKDPKAKFRWHITMSSDTVAASSQGYATYSLCLENAKSVLGHLIWLKENDKLK